MTEFQIKNIPDLEKTIFTLNTKIEKTKQKILAASGTIDEMEEPQAKQSKFSKMAFESDKEMYVFVQNIRKMVIKFSGNLSNEL